MFGKGRRDTGRPTSRDHHIVARALGAGATSEEGRWLKWDHGHPIVFEGNFDLVELDLAHPPVADYIVEVMTYWLGRGIDGWRLDAAFAPGAAAWRPIIDRVKAAFPHGWIVAEVIHVVESVGYRTVGPGGSRAGG